MWVSGARVTVRAIGLINTAVVARLLTPADYGIVALGMSIWALLDSFTNLDTNTYLVRAKTVSRDDLNVAFTLNLLGNLLVAAAVLAGAPALAAFLGDPRLANVLYIVAAIIVINGLRNPAMAHFVRRQDFSRESMISISAKLSSVAVTIYFAFALGSFYALIIGIAFSYVWRTVGSYVVWPYLPRFSLRNAGAMFRFGAWLTGANAMGSVSMKLDRFIIQKFVNAGAVGIYSMASDLIDMIKEQLVVPVHRALLPAMARAQNDIVELRRLYRDSVAAVFAVVAPAALGMALVAEDLILLLLGDQWTQSADLLRPMAAVTALHLLSINYRSVFLALGQTRQLFNRNVALFLIRPSAFFGGVYWAGLEGGVWGYAVSEICMMGIELLFLRRLIGLTAGSILRACSRSIASLAVMAMAVLSVAHFLPDAAGEGAALVRLSAQVGAGAIGYAVMHLLLWHLAGRPFGIESRLLSLLARKLSIGAE